MLGVRAYITQTLHHATLSNRISHRVQHAGQTSRGLQRNRHVEQITLSIRNIRSGAETLRRRIPQLAVNVVSQIHNRPLNLSDPRIQRIQISLRRSVSPRRSIRRIISQLPRLIPLALSPGCRLLRMDALRFRLDAQLPSLRTHPLSALLHVAHHPVVGTQIGGLHKDAVLSQVAFDGRPQDLTALSDLVRVDQFRRVGNEEVVCDLRIDFSQEVDDLSAHRRGTTTRRSRSTRSKDLQLLTLPSKRPARIGVVGVKRFEGAFLLRIRNIPDIPLAAPRSSIRVETLTHRVRRLLHRLIPALPLRRLPRLSRHTASHIPFVRGQIACVNLATSQRLPRLTHLIPEPTQLLMQLLRLHSVNTTELLHMIYKRAQIRIQRAIGIRPRLIHSIQQNRRSLSTPLHTHRDPARNRTRSSTRNVEATLMGCPQHPRLQTIHSLSELPIVGVTLGHAILHNACRLIRKRIARIQSIQHELRPCRLLIQPLRQALPDA